MGAEWAKDDPRQYILGPVLFQHLTSLRSSQSISFCESRPFCEPHSQMQCFFILWPGSALACMFNLIYLFTTFRQVLYTNVFLSPSLKGFNSNGLINKRAHKVVGMCFNSRDKSKYNTVYSFKFVKKKGNSRIIPCQQVIEASCQKAH